MIKLRLRITVADNTIVHRNYFVARLSLDNSAIQRFSVQALTPN